MYVLDTHLWIWWLCRPDILPKKILTVLKKAFPENNLALSSISVWEVAMLSERGRLVFATDYREFIAQSEKLSFLRFVPADNDILLKSVTLPGYTENDPADRIILATTNHLGATLITKDEKLLNYRHVRTLWE